MLKILWDSTFLKKLVTLLNSQFALKDLGKLHFFLGIEVRTSSIGLHLSQHKYIQDLLQRVVLESTNPYDTHIVVGKILTKYVGIPLTNPTLYKTLTGALQYCVMTRP